jgi:SAM-dependent methyltransferase
MTSDADQHPTPTGPPPHEHGDRGHDDRHGGDPQAQDEQARDPQAHDEQAREEQGPDHQPDQQPGHGHGHGHGLTATDFAAIVDLLDLDGEVFAGLLHDAVALVRSTTGERVHRIADVGCGNGSGTLALARAYPDAYVASVDVAAPLLDHLLDQARSLDAAGPSLDEAAEGSPLVGRIRPVVADLDQPWPAELHELDLVWASASIHHLADPPAGLAGLYRSIVGGGWLALTEVDDIATFQPLFLPDGGGSRDGLESRARGVLAPDLTSVMPYLGADWGPLLTEAGFDVVADQVFDVTLAPPLPDSARRYALVMLRRLREQLQSSGRDAELAPEDVAALDALVTDGPGCVEHRDDLVPRTRRRLWIARRP